MIIISTGKGRFIVVFLIINFLLFFLVPNTDNKEPFWLALGLLVTALEVFLLDQYLKKTEKGRAVREKSTGREMILKPNHSLYFINIKYWPIIFMILSSLFFYSYISS